MDTRQLSLSPWPESMRPQSQRQRSNSFPIVDALGCSTPEAQLLLAEGRAAVRKRREKGRRNRSVNDESITTFDPRDHVQYLHELSLIATPQERLIAQEPRACHARMPSDATDTSTCTVITRSHDGETGTGAPPISPLGDYSANLAQFIKAQLKSIPTYKPCDDASSSLSPHSCPELSFPHASPPLSPTKVSRRTTDAPQAIDIPPVRPPMLSAFSAWSSTTEDDKDGEALPIPGLQAFGMGSLSKASSYTPSVLGYYESSDNSSFLFTSTPQDEEPDPGTATRLTFPDQSTLPGFTTDTHTHDSDDDESPSSSHSRPQLTSSVPSYTSSTSSSSYFDCKYPTAISSSMRDRIVAAVTPPHPPSKMLSPISPWEGSLMDSQQRVHVDGMSFDMMRDFGAAHRATPC